MKINPVIWKIMSSLLTFYCHNMQPDSETQVLTIQFEWHGILKSVSSTLIGVSPEFELALYTLCYFVGREDNGVNLGPYCVNIKCYRMGNDKIGSVFPIVED
jgi:poly(U)-specific endoribonuclease